MVIVALEFAYDGAVILKRMGGRLRHETTSQLHEEQTGASERGLVQATRAAESRNDCHRNENESVSVRVEIASLRADLYAFRA